MRAFGVNMVEHQYWQVTKVAKPKPMKKRAAQKPAKPTTDVIAKHGMAVASSSSEKAAGTRGGACELRGESDERSRCGARAVPVR